MNTGENCRNYHVQFSAKAKSGDNGWKTGRCFLAHSFFSRYAELTFSKIARCNESVQSNSTKLSKLTFLQNPPLIPRRTNSYRNSRSQFTAVQSTHQLLTTPSAIPSNLTFHMLAKFFFPDTVIFRLKQKSKTFR